jgi:hypothetical protein
MSSRYQTIAPVVARAASDPDLPLAGPNGKCQLGHSQACALHQALVCQLPFDLATTDASEQG